MLRVGHTVEDELKDKYCVMRSAHPIKLHCMPCVHPLIEPACDAVEAACNDKVNWLRFSRFEVEGQLLDRNVCCLCNSASWHMPGNKPLLETLNHR